ncbi:hypothetical protein [Streptomyces griseorubiginosus]|uniref:hypothetical protein n=1 Tax=Streptomyces griseorubiginosus TaxID=67304 RepID=UPI002E81094A|nr:hypothetical protein [Streptomyces griseorubiginosus]WUB44611.1 hypothetical protein OHN19_15185 [Streptomyces griseorubiginosus]WUB53128.1 hypothetical protein OG942_15180 [Streptomyces griseorubiginosus]
MGDHLRSPRIGCAVLSLAVLLLAACSGEKEPEVEYAVPDALCGVPTGTEAVEPFFPPGSKLTKTGGALNDGKYASGCDYAVDSAKTLMVSDFFHEDIPTARQIAQKRAADYGDGDTKVVVSDNVAVYSRGAVAVEPCRGYPSDTDGLPRKSFSVEIVAYYPKDLAKQEKTLTRLVTKLVPAVAKANGC